MNPVVSPCPCGTGLDYAACCQPLHRGRVSAQTAEQLMRARYSAYRFKLVDYLVETTHPDKRSATLAAEIEAWATETEFVRLEILSTRQGQATDKIGKVEFIAHFLQAGKELQMHETSRFRRFKTCWVYLDGDIR